jgi:hypothetical protein
MMDEDAPPDDRPGWIAGVMVPHPGLWETRLVGDMIWHRFIGDCDIIYGPEDYAALGEPLPPVGET